MISLLQVWGYYKVWGTGYLETPGDGGLECCAHAGREGGGAVLGCKSPVLPFGAIQQRVLVDEHIFA